MYCSASHLLGSYGRGQDGSLMSACCSSSLHRNYNKAFIHAISSITSISESPKVYTYKMWVTSEITFPGHHSPRWQADIILVLLISRIQGGMRQDSMP